MALAAAGAAVDGGMAAGAAATVAGAVAAGHHPITELVSRWLGEQRVLLDGLWRGLVDLVRTGKHVRRAWATAAGTAIRYPGYGVAMPMAYSYFPTWGMSTYSGWGLGSLANSWLYSGYTNPYYATVVAAQPAQTTVVYDYSQPINVTAAPPDASVTESTEQVFSAARDAFMAGDYQRALDLSDQVLKQTPNAAVVHEFRATLSLCAAAIRRRGRG